MSTEPFYQHDCKKCVYIASTHGHGGMHDWYVCDQAFGGTTIVRRDTDEGADFSSWPAFLLNEKYREAADVFGNVGQLESHILAHYMLDLYQASKT